MTQRYTEDEQDLLNILHADPNSLELNKYYKKYRPAFEQFISRYFINANNNQAYEIYPEAFHIMYINIRKGKLKAPLKSTLQTYLFGIGKNLYHKRFLGKNITITSDSEDWKEIPDCSDLIEEQTRNEEHKDLVKQLLSQISKSCQELLTLIYLKGYANDAVAEEMNIPTEGAVRKRKFICLKKLRDLLSK